MGSETEQRSASGWLQRRSDKRAAANEVPHQEVEEQLRSLSRQWRRGIVSHTTGLRPHIDLEHDNVRGSADAKVTLVEYGDFESVSCKAATRVVGRLSKQFGDDMRVAFRHFPIADAHSNAVSASVACLAAGAQGSYWEMHDRIFAGEFALKPATLRAMAGRLKLDLDRYDTEVADGTYLTHIFEDFNSGVLSGVNGCPTFFVNEQRLDWDFNDATLEDTLTRAVAVVDDAAAAAAS